METKKLGGKEIREWCVWEDREMGDYDQNTLHKVPQELKNSETGQTHIDTEKSLVTVVLFFKTESLYIVLAVLELAM